MALTQEERGLLGATKNREIAVKRYYKSPNYCLECGSIIHVEEGRKVADIKRKKFCNHSCAASFNNRRYPKREAVTSGYCEICGKYINYKKQKNGYYSPRKFCDECKDIGRGRSLSKTLVKQGRLSRESAVIERTIDELKSIRNGYWSWRVEITKHARKIYIQSNLPQKCLICGYDKHFDVCHKKDVSTFDGNTTIAEINNINNLIALCRNHHWEFDHNLLEQFDNEKIDVVPR